jgi:hypothetical protein
MKFIKYEERPEWIEPYREPIKYKKGVNIPATPFDIIGNVRGQKLNCGIIKRVFLTIYHNTDKGMICQNIVDALADTRQYYNADEVVLQGKFTENYGLQPKFLAENMFIDGIELSTKEMMFSLREFNIECFPILALNHKVDINTINEIKEKSSIKTDGIICTNRQKGLSFLF